MFHYRKLDFKQNTLGSKLSRYMKTTTYNPSDLEIELASVIKELQDKISDKLSTNRIENIELNSDKDNPDLIFELIDNDGDRHELVVKFIQRADQ